VEPAASAAWFEAPGDGSGCRPVSTPRYSTTDSVAGFLAALSLALSGIAIVRQPGLLAPAAALVAIVAARMTVAYRTLTFVAVMAAALAFLVGMTVAVLTDSRIY
jgi:hypothetical protein